MRNFLRGKLFRNMRAERLRIEIELRTELLQCFCLRLANRWVSARTTQDWTHQLLDVSIESECLCHGCRSATTRRELFLSRFSLVELASALRQSGSQKRTQASAGRPVISILVGPPNLLRNGRKILGLQQSSTLGVPCGKPSHNICVLSNNDSIYSAANV